MEKENERWLSVEEISAHIGVSKDTIRSWIKKGTIPYHKIGRQYKFRVTEVNAWIESGESANADK
ncbi:MAG: helix-turn-helix domain-containing protein [Butyrivibrio sp.]|nr:helix-turn-helix domain-containing protein [Butyrivibrio sp.]